MDKMSIIILIIGIAMLIPAFCSMFLYEKAQLIDNSYTFRSEDKKFIILEYGGWDNDASNQARRILIDKESGMMYLNGEVIYNADGSLKIYDKEDK